jgi:hypothetical protein
MRPIVPVIPYEDILSQELIVHRTVNRHNFLFDSIS